MKTKVVIVFSLLLICVDCKLRQRAKAAGKAVARGAGRAAKTSVAKVGVPVAGYELIRRGGGAVYDALFNENSTAPPSTSNELMQHFFPVTIAVGEELLTFQKAEWTSSVLYSRLATAFEARTINKICLESERGITVQLAADDTSLGPLLKYAARSDTNLKLFLCNAN